MVVVARPKIKLCEISVTNQGSILGKKYLSKDMLWKEENRKRENRESK